VGRKQHERIKEYMSNLGSMHEKKKVEEKISDLIRVKRLPNVITTLRGRYYLLLFIEKDTKLWRRGDLPVVTKLDNDRTENRPQAFYFYTS
jgi:hypothetical protein